MVGLMSKSVVNSSYLYFSARSAENGTVLVRHSEVKQSPKTAVVGKKWDLDVKNRSEKQREEAAQKKDDEFCAPIRKKR